MNRLGVVSLILSACAGSKPAPATSPASAPPPLAISNTTPSVDTDNALVAKRWVYAAFFNRLKHRVRDNWDPATVWKALPAVTRGSLGTARRETTVEASLAPDGTLVQLAIVQSSGVTELDAEAIRAFQVSSPFGTTPTGLTPFKFSFYFDVGGSTSTVSAP